MGRVERQLVISLTLLLGASAAHAQSLKIEEKTDAPTKESMLVGGPLKVCMSAGRKCAALTLTWSKQQPEVVSVFVELPNASVGIRQLELRMDGEMRTFESAVAADVVYDAGNTVSHGQWTSANTFVVPLKAIQALAVQQPRILRVTGGQDTFDLDFDKRAKMRGLPADELQQFLTAIASKSPR